VLLLLLLVPLLLRTPRMHRYPLRTQPLPNHNLPIALTRAQLTVRCCTELPCMQATAQLPSDQLPF
jgi:hypothetical protein